MTARIMICRPTIVLSSLALAASVGCGCRAPTVTTTTNNHGASSNGDNSDVIIGLTRTPVPDRLVAIGDVHGDLNSFRQALTLADVIDASGDWAAGNLVVVQTGDILDRGDDERLLLDWMQTLSEQAEMAGGVFVRLLGNHEIMNAQHDFRYVTPDGFNDFGDFPDTCANVDGSGRWCAFNPSFEGAQYADLLSHLDVVAIAGDSIFVHGGIRRSHVEYGLDRVNQETRAWLAGDAAAPAILNGEDSPVWTRVFSDPQLGGSCDELAEVLELVGVQRMVVGHTVQPRGITSACNGQIWRIDVGLADYYGGPTQALEIIGDVVRVIE